MTPIYYITMEGLRIFTTEELVKEMEDRIKTKDLKVFTNEQIIEEMKTRRNVYVIQKKDIEWAICREISYVEEERFNRYYKDFGHTIQHHDKINEFIVEFFYKQLDISDQRLEKRKKKRYNIFDV